MNGHIPVIRDDLPLAAAMSTKVADFILSHGQGWEHRKIFAFFDAPSARQILVLELPVHSSVRDALYWPFTKPGDFHLKQDTILSYNLNKKIFTA